MDGAPRRRWLVLTPLVIACNAGVCSGGGPGLARPVLTNVPGHPLNVVPGLPGVSFAPGPALFADRLTVSPDGQRWIARCLVNRATTQNEVVLSGLATLPGGGVFLCLEEGAVMGLAENPGEAAGPISSRMAITDGGAFACVTTTGAPAPTNSVVVRGTVGLGGLSSAVRGGDPVPGFPPGVMFGTGLQACGMTADLRLLVLSPTTAGLPAAENTLLLLGSDVLIQEGVTVPNGAVEPWSAIAANAVRMNGDGTAWMSGGSLVAPTTQDTVLAVNGGVVAREGSVLAGSGFISPVGPSGTVGDWAMTSGGDWLARGVNADGQMWLARNGAVVAKTGDPVPGGAPGEVFTAPAFGAAATDQSGDVVAFGTTDHPDPSRRGVLVQLGRGVLMRTGDAFDLNGNGVIDEDAHVAAFLGDRLVTAGDNEAWGMCRLHDSDNVLIGTVVFAMAKFVQPDEVFVFNGGADGQGRADEFDSPAMGEIFDELGLLGPDGEPPTGPAPGSDELKQGNTVVGYVIRNNQGEVIGYESADRKKRAYNVDTTATMKDAWNAVKPGGTVTVAKHGTPGGILLDGGKLYPGFKTEGQPGGGTGMVWKGEPDLGPYPLPAKGGAPVNVFLNACNSATDPDPNDPTARPVTDSADDIPGTNTPTGHTGLTVKAPCWCVDTNAELVALQKCAKKLGFVDKNDNGDVDKMLATIPFMKQREKLLNCMAGVPGAGVRIRYVKNGSCPACPPGLMRGVEQGLVGPSAGYYLPIQTVDPVTGAYMRRQAHPDDVFIDVFVPPGAVSGRSTVQVRPIDAWTRAAIPAGLKPAAAAAEVSRHSGVPLSFSIPASVTVSFPANTPIAGVYRIESNGSLTPWPTMFLDPVAGVCSVETSGDMALLLLTPIPPSCPGDFNGDGVINTADLVVFLGSFGQSGVGLPADLNNDGSVNTADLVLFLGLFGTQCP